MLFFSFLYLFTLSHYELKSYRHSFGAIGKQSHKFRYCIVGAVGFVNRNDSKTCKEVIIFDHVSDKVYKLLCHNTEYIEEFEIGQSMFLENILHRNGILIVTALYLQLLNWKNVMSVLQFRIYVKV